jgi:hypothetical protein
MQMEDILQEKLVLDEAAASVLHNTVRWSRAIAFGGLGLLTLVTVAILFLGGPVDFSELGDFIYFIEWSLFLATNILLYLFSIRLKRAISIDRTQLPAAFSLLRKSLLVFILLVVIYISYDFIWGTLKSLLLW